MPKGDSIYYFIAVNAEGVVSDVTTRVYNFTPEILRLMMRHLNH